MRHISLAFALLLPLGCSDDTKAGDCPASRPQQGEPCSLASDKVCTFPLTVPCTCGTSPEPKSTCTCQQGKWKCEDLTDVCLPCTKDRGIDGRREAGARDQSTDGTKKGCVPACGSGQVCVQFFDGTCKTSGPSCRTVSAACLTAGCTVACEHELCPSPYQCQNQVPCGTEQGAQLNCYGP